VRVTPATWGGEEVVARQRRCHVQGQTAIKKNKTLTHVTAWMNFENTMFTERSRIQKTTYYTILLYET
jgi:hypothetical protein